MSESRAVRRRADRDGPGDERAGGGGVRLGRHGGAGQGGHRGSGDPGAVGPSAATCREPRGAVPAPPPRWGAPARRRPGAVAAASAVDDSPMTRASLEKHPREVAAMFDDVAEQYDLTNDVLSLGQDRRWRARRRGAARPVRGSGCSTSPPAPAPRASPSPTRASRCAGRLLARDAPGRAPAPPRPRLHRRRRDAAAVRRRLLRRRDDVVRAAQRRPTPARRSPSSCASPGRVAGWLCASSARRSTRLPHGLHQVPHARPAADRAAHLEQPGVLRLPRGVDPGLAGAARDRRADRGCRLGRRQWRNLTGGIVALHRATSP